MGTWDIVKGLFKFGVKAEKATETIGEISETRVDLNSGNISNISWDRFKKTVKYPLIVGCLVFLIILLSIGIDKGDWGAATGFGILGGFVVFAFVYYVCDRYYKLQTGAKAINSAINKVENLTESSVAQVVPPQ